MTKKHTTTTVTYIEEQVNLSPGSKIVIGDVVKGDYIKGDKIVGDKIVRGDAVTIIETVEVPPATKVKVWFGDRPIIAEHYWWDVEAATWNLHDRIETGCIYVLAEGLSKEPDYLPKQMLGCHSEKQARKV